MTTHSTPTPPSASTRPPAVGPPSSRTNGWTGGQYSVWRALLALFLAWFWTRGLLDSLANSPSAAELILHHGWFTPEPIAPGLDALQAWTLLVVEFAACAALALGWKDRVAALVLIVPLAWLVSNGHSLHTLVPTLIVGLLVHLALPRAPFGSVDALGRADPAGAWSFRPWVAYAMRAVPMLLLLPMDFGRLGQRLALGPEAYAEWARIASEAGAPVLRALGDLAPAYLCRAANALDLLPFALAPLALWPRAWKVLWCLLAARAALLATLARPEDLLGPGSVVPWLYLALVFDPAWIPARGAGVVERLYYDGACGLCQRAVRFVLAEDPEGRAFRFAPLQGETFARELDAGTRATLPDSLVIRTSDGRVLTRSDAVVHLLARLGGFWRVASVVLALVPRPVRDAGYDAIARMRKRLFAAPKELCPLGPRHVTERFDR